jgi:hypothetical protein
MAAANQPAPKERKKYDEMQKVTVEARKKHNLPESEVVIEGKGAFEAPVNCRN